MNRWLSRAALFGAATALGLSVAPAAQAQQFDPLEVGLTVTCGSSGTIPVFHTIDISVQNIEDANVTLTAATLTPSGATPANVLSEITPNPVLALTTSTAHIAPFPYEPGQYVLVISWSAFGGEETGSTTATADGPTCMEPTTSTSRVISTSTSTTRVVPARVTPKFTG